MRCQNPLETFEEHKLIQIGSYNPAEVTSALKAQVVDNTDTKLN